MNITTMLQLCSACVGVLGSLFFAIGILRQSDESMAKLSGSIYGWNPHIVAALAAQKSDYIFGGGLIVFAFGIQVVTFLIPGLEVTQRQFAIIAPWGFVALTIVAFFILRKLSKKLAQRFEQNILTKLESMRSNT